MTCEQTVESGAYVLGALAPAERAAYERHLAGCAVCRSEVGLLAGLPGLLGRLDARTAAGISDATAPPLLLIRVVSEVRRVRARLARRRRWQAIGAALAAACLTAIAAITAIALTTGPHGNHTSAAAQMVVAQMQPTDPRVPLSAVLGYAPSGSGTQIQMQCVYNDPQAWGNYWMLTLVVVPRDGGQPQTLNSWPATEGVPVQVSAHTNLAPNQIARFELHQGSKVLLAYQTV